MDPCFHHTDHVMHIKPGIISFLFVADRRGTRCGLLLKSSFWCSGWTSAAHLHHVHMHRYTECLTRDWLIQISALLSTWTGVPAECTLWKWKFAVGHSSLCNLLQIFAVKLNSCAHTQGYTETKSLGVMTPAPPKPLPKAVCMGQRSGSPPKEHFKHEWLCWKNRPNT